MQQSLIFVLTCIFRFIFCQKCQLEVLDTSEYIGCFKDFAEPNRILPHWGYGDWPSNDNNRCILFCRDKGHLFAGTDYGVHCLCGDYVDPSTVTSGCTYACAGDPLQICGGLWRLSIYRTGLTNSSSYVGFGRYFSTVVEGKNLNVTKQAISRLPGIDSPIHCAAFCMRYEGCTGFVLSIVTRSCSLYQLLYHDLCDNMVIDNNAKIYKLI